ncbi:MAG: OmpH family outer membrane protein [Bacteroidales bacterium]|nr:OmpH family outer membrane protein [Bacteroidales bacterium]
MKRVFLFAVALIFATLAFGQKYAYVDTEYILNNIPVYESAKTQLEDLTNEWKKEIDAKKSSIDQMYQNYQSERILLTEELRAKREDEIMKKEQELKQLQQKYFGESGMLYKKREELIKPIQDDIYNAIKEIATEGNFAVIFDTANNLNMLYTDPRHDKSDEVLRKLGYKN